MTEQHRTSPYFPHIIQVTDHYWRSLGLGPLSQLIRQRGIPQIVFYRQLALALNRSRSIESPAVHASHLNLFGTLQSVLRYLVDVVAEEQVRDVLLHAAKRRGIEPLDPDFSQTAECFVKVFPPDAVLSGREDGTKWLTAERNGLTRRRMVARELLLLRLAAQNPAVDAFRDILDEQELAARCPNYRGQINEIFAALAEGPLLSGLEMTLAEALLAPIHASPNSLAGQIGFIREKWNDFLPPELIEELEISLDVLLEEERERSWGGHPGPPPVLEFERGGATGGIGHGLGSSVFGGYDYPEYERFSADADWMSNVVLMAKMVYVWLDQLSRQYGYPVSRLDQIPDAELDRLARAGFSGLWLIGVWQRSDASQRIKQLCGNPEAIASAYSLYDYEIAEDLGGWEALGNLRERAARRGIRLASDMVPNHTGIYSRWVIQHPDWFIQTEYPPFPTYQFTGENLSHSDNAIIQIEDGYWTKTDAAVVFRYIERHTGRTRYIYHGNDGTSIPWNDTAQLNYMLPEVREAAIQTILHVARNFPIIRFDAAMTLAKKHFQRLWFPIRGLGGGIPSRAEQGMSREEFDALFPVEFWREVVDRVAVEAPGTLLLAEAFWMMEGYFVRTLGMHRVYNSAFMNMLKMEENAKYRQTIKNVLEFNHEVLKRFVNFMNNPDERTAVEQFGTQGKYFGACVLMVTMPGLPMFGHGQIEGYHEKYGMEYKRAYWDESPDQGLVRGHEMWIFPLLRKRWLFSDSTHFVLYDFFAGTTVDENVFAYSNRSGDQRALILYNNRYDSTAGWIRESAAFAVKGPNGDNELRRTTLAQALDLRADADIYYAFREVASGLEFLRSGAELVEKGLYAELAEYQFYVFIEFSEIRDDSARTWSSLCAALNGRGVDSLEVERRQVRYASPNAAYKHLLGQISASKTRSIADLLDSRCSFLHSAQRFLSLLKVHSDGPSLEIDDILERLRNAFSLISAICTLEPRRKGAKHLLSGLRTILSAPFNLQLLVSWIVVSSRPEAFNELGLDYTLQQVVAGQSTEQDQPGTAPAMLLKALLSTNQPKSACTETLAGMFSTMSSAEFLCVHESGGVLWFNKERLELLIAWLNILHLVEWSAERPSARAMTAWLVAADLETQRLVDLASHAGYRVALYLQLISPQSGEDAKELEQKRSPKTTARKSRGRETTD